MRVVANSIGYFGAVRVAGEEFEVPEGVKGSWFSPVAPSQLKPTGKAKRKDGEGDDSAPDDAANAI